MCHKARVQTRNPYPPKPVPAVRVRVSWGWGTGSPGKPQGYPCQSLSTVKKDSDVSGRMSSWRSYDIPTDSLSQIAEILGEIPIVKHDLSWDCQTWVILATKLLKSAGFVFAQVVEPYVQERQLEDMARWEEAENTVDERLIASSGESA